VPYVHSNIFQRLVEDRDDLAGLVAYGLYQTRKREWLKDFQAEHNRLPEQQDLVAYAFTYRDDVLISLKEQARGSLYKFSSEIMRVQTLKMQEDALNGRILAELSGIGKRLGKISGYRHHIVGHIFGFFALLALALFITFAISHEPSIGDFVRKILP
jgi:hypothetical protein